MKENKFVIKSYEYVRDLHGKVNENQFFTYEVFNKMQGSPFYMIIGRGNYGVEYESIGTRFYREIVYDTMIKNIVSNKIYFCNEEESLAYYDQYSEVSEQYKNEEKWIKKIKDEMEKD